LPESVIPASPRYGTRLGHWIFYIVLKWFGPLPAYFMLAFVVPYYVFILKRPRREAKFYLKRMFPDDTGFRRLLRIYQYIYSLGLCLIDQAAIGILGREKFDIDFPDREKLYELSRSEKSIVLLTSHVGYWQTSMAVVDDMDKTVNFLMRLEEHVAERYFFNLSGNDKSIKIIDPAAFMGGLVEAAQALQRSETVCIMGDRAWGARTNACNFLGNEALFPVTPYHLVAANGADLVIILTARTGKLAFRIDYIHIPYEHEDLKGQSKKNMTDILMKKYVKALESYVKKYPYMWFNFFDFWNINKEKYEVETL
jgi:predicted LPLAT superfamily acyltransferase